MEGLRPDTPCFIDIDLPTQQSTESDKKRRKKKPKKKKTEEEKKAEAEAAKVRGLENLYFIIFVFPPPPPPRYLNFFRLRPSKFLSFTTRLHKKPRKLPRLRRRPRLSRRPPPSLPPRVCGCWRFFFFLLTKCIYSHNADNQLELGAVNGPEIAFPAHVLFWYYYRSLCFTCASSGSSWPLPLYLLCFFPSFLSFFLWLFSLKCLKYFGVFFFF